MYFGSLGIPICEVFGMSECTGPETVWSALLLCVLRVLLFLVFIVHSCCFRSTPQNYVVGSCGYPLDGTEIKLEHVQGRDKPGEGELCWRGRNVCMVRSVRACAPVFFLSLSDSR